MRWSDKVDDMFTSSSIDSTSSAHTRNVTSLCGWSWGNPCANYFPMLSYVECLQPTDGGINIMQIVREMTKTDFSALILAQICHIPKARPCACKHNGIRWKLQIFTRVPVALYAEDEVSVSTCQPHAKLFSMFRSSFPWYKNTHTRSHADPVREYAEACTEATAQVHVMMENKCQKLPIYYIWLAVTAPTKAKSY